LWNSVQTSKEIRTYLTIVNIKNGRHVISRSEKRVKHIVLVSAISWREQVNLQ